MDTSHTPENEKPRHSGMFKPGQSGNPSGRPKSDETIRDLARAHTDDALRALVEVMNNTRAPHSSRVHAACALLDRGWGKPAQYIENVNRGMTLQELAEQIYQEELKDPTPMTLTKAGACGIVLGTTDS